VRPRVAIAGAGLAGLSCAVALADRADCWVFERLPVAGGEAWEQPRVAAQVAAAIGAGARLLAGTQVLRFEAGRLLAVGQNTVADRFDALVVATGHRPLTRAELQIEGPRAGGVLPGTVAEHLLHHGVDLGRAVLVGDATAGPLLEALLSRSARRLAVLLPDGAARGLPEQPRLEVHEWTRPLELVGWPRVQRVLAGPRRGAIHLSLDCDTVILAYGRVPYRNVEGAVFGADDVVFAQAGAGVRDGEATEAAGAAAARRVLRLLEQTRTPKPLGGRT
jgi:hypothetical protein